MKVACAYRSAIFSETVQHAETELHWASNMKSYVDCRIASLLMTLNDPIYKLQYSLTIKLTAAADCYSWRSFLNFYTQPVFYTSVFSSGKNYGLPAGKEFYFDDLFSRFDTILECDRQKHGWTETD